MTNLAEKVKDKLKDAKDTVSSKGTRYDSTEHYEANEPIFYLGRLLTKIK
jgi:hypothetical protein